MGGARSALLSANPARRAVERYWLAYTGVWGAVAAAVMLTGLAESWGDVELMILGVAFAAGATVPPLLRPHASDRELPLLQRTCSKLVASVVGLSLLMNYFCTPYFFDVLHMHYGFQTHINIQNNPVFLYLMTIAYFATYAVLLCASYRFSQRVLPSGFRAAGAVIAPLVVAALETALNANPWMTSLFCFDDMPLMMWFGTLSYGACFVFALPMWMSIDEEPAARTTMRQVGARVLVVMMVIVITFELLRHLVAPLVTTVQPNANGLRDFDSSCLVRPTP